MFDNNELLIRRVEQLEQANAALVARNKMLEVLGDKDKSKQVKETAKSRLAVKKQRGCITVVKNELPSEL